LWLLLSLLVLFGFSTSAVAQHAHADEGSDLDPYVGLVSELTGRARANVYFANPQDVFHGAQVNFVNVGTGNLTFLRRDMVSGGRVPLVLARVYDSSSAGSAEFGPGWMLSAAETISIHDHVASLSSESGSVLDFAEAGNNTFVLSKDRPSDYSLLRRTAPDTLQAVLRTGLVKEYKLIAGLYRLARVADRNGNEVRLGYKNGVLSRLENANHFIDLTRNDQGRIVLAQDDLGRQVRYSYDPKGRLAQVQDVGGASWRYGYREDGRLAAATDPMQRPNFGVVYDGAGRVRLLQLPSGAIQFSYDPGSGSTTVLDRRALQSRYFQNQEGITTQVVNALGEETAIGLDAARNPVTLSRNGAVMESLQYDQRHRLVSRHNVTASGALDLQYSYDPASGLLTRIDSSDGTSSAFTYDAGANLSSALLADGLHKYGYFPSGDLAAYSAAGTDLTFASSPEGLIASMNDGAAVTRFAYNGRGELSQAAFADGRSAGYDYQPSGLRARLLYKDGRRVEYSYDPAGNLTSTKIFDAKGKQVGGQALTLNDSYQVVKRALFDGSEESFQYDPNGNLIEHSVGGAVTRFEYDALNRLVAVLTPDGQRLTYSYDPGERSIVDSYEHASVQVADLRDTGFTFASAAQVMSTRPVTAGWGALRFSESLGTFQLANSAGTEVITPEVVVEQTLHKLDLVVPGVALEARQGPFNRPFNPAFIPAEYATINCCIECPIFFRGSPPTDCPDCDPGLPPDPPPPAPTITQDHDLYWFNGENPPGFTDGGIQATLTASGEVTSGTYSWVITTGTNKVLFGNNGTSFTSTANSVVIKSIGRSTTPNDVSISVTYTDGNGSASAAASLSVRAPSKLSPGSPPATDQGVGADCGVPGTTGFRSFISYTIFDQFDRIVHNSGINEHLGQEVPTIGNNWGVPTEMGSATPDGTFADEICVAGTNLFDPLATAPQNPLSSAEVDRIDQAWYAGSTNTAFPFHLHPGVRVQNNTMQRFIDHGRHVNIISPPPAQ
jgi:YD repeat-containing protein